LPYKQSQQLLSDSLGFEPCSARETERIANQHGNRIEQMRSEGELSPAAGREPNKKDLYCMAIDAGMIPGLPDPDTHPLDWHDVKLAVVFDPKKIAQPFYVAGREDAEKFGKRLWKELELRRIYHDRFQLILGDWSNLDLEFSGNAFAWSATVARLLSRGRAPVCDCQPLLARIEGTHVVASSS
jgi:hypothetical protein